MFGQEVSKIDQVKLATSPFQDPSDVHVPVVRHCRDGRQSKAFTSERLQRLSIRTLGALEDDIPTVPVANYGSILSGGYIGLENVQEVTVAAKMSAFTQRKATQTLAWRLGNRWRQPSSDEKVTPEGVAEEVNSSNFESQPQKSKALQGSCQRSKRLTSRERDEGGGFDLQVWGCALISAG